MFTIVGSDGTAVAHTLVASVALAASAIAGGCGGGYYGDYTTDSEEFEEPGEVVPPSQDLIVDITVTAALVAPAKIDGCQWDGLSCNPVSPDLLTDFSDLAGTVAAAAVGVPRNSAISELVSYVLGGVIGTLSKPDPRGQISISARNGSLGPVLIPERSDSFKIDIDYTVTGIVLDSSFRMTIQLEDVDQINHDTIGTVILRQDEIIDALNEERTVWIPTFEGDGALAAGIVAVELSVFESR